MSTAGWNETATQRKLYQIHSPNSGTSAGPENHDIWGLNLKFRLPWHEFSAETQYMSPLLPSSRSVPFTPAEICIVKRRERER